VIESTEHPVGADGAEVIGLIAERLRRVLAVLAEHNSDDEMELVTRVLAETTLLVLGELELGWLLRDA
jgi:hypothetical protein